MPELPEVEAVKVGLNQLVKGKKIMKVEVLWPRIIESPDFEAFQSDLIGEEIEQVSRRGKYLIFHFTHWDLISHLRMEGKYEFHQQSTPCLKHTHVVFYFEDGSELCYLDVRKFGRMVLVPKETAQYYKGIAKLGPEPVQDSFKKAQFKKQLKKHSKAIKPVLLDQTLVTGLGNIYVDEALFLAKIHPERPANSLSEKEVAGLHAAIIKVLFEAVAAGGTTVRSYLNALGEAGNFQQQLKAYGKEGQPCVRCGTAIKKIKVAQRGTHFCPKCQKFPKV
ncbi:DNA-formamidopyrimidine glycosylase [Vagococcus entomophilus]|uniref:Formamidopyrimidine-DNA glycosylase n=1 Tax=Vagococcus entomophilus TaxID=1160095 RepID=A0A430AK69_9ENTE|nr:DNA-formamidopyrimidine glycosylase [Vagococcus entomophilus]RSU08403.1 DNA-formamidopyrimidine glycosylase [Vagococcus entomophilus]